MKKLLLAVGLGILALYLSLTPITEAQSGGRNITVLSGALRSADTNSTDLANTDVNLNTKGAYVTLDVTAIADTPLITLSIQYKDTISGKYENLLTASSGVSAAGTHTYLVYPGAGSASADVTQVAGFPLPQTWRVSVDHADTDAITYTVGAVLLP